MSQSKEDMDTVTALVCVIFFCNILLKNVSLFSLCSTYSQTHSIKIERAMLGAPSTRCRRLEELSKAGYVRFCSLSLSLHISTYYYINNIISCCTHFVYTTWYFRIRVFLRSSGRIIRWNSERDD